MNIFKVTLSNSVNFECTTDQTILEGAKNAGIYLEHSCRNGRCGVCVAKVIEGKATALIQEDAIDETKLNDKNILTCCRSPRTDLKLDIDDLGDIGLMRVLTLPCRLSSLEIINNEICFVGLRLPPSASFEFIPGQYIDVIKGDVRRSYSIANAPREDGLIELQIKKVQNGKLSDYFFDNALTNDLLRLEGPLGTFSLREDESKNIVFMATGTGIAPIKAFLESLASNPSNKNIYIVWGGRYQEDLYLDFHQINFHFKFVRVLSREKVDGYYYGYVQDAVLELGIDLTETACYACGSIEMINSASRLLIENGLKKRQFHSDAFVSSS